ncbi:hypothetical protein ACN28S_33835 [Cystobacter fuscus]
MTGEELLQRKLKWEKTPDAFHPMRTEVDGQELRIRVGDFPEEALYTLLAGDEELAQFDDWPKTWQRPPPTSPRASTASPRRPSRTNKPRRPLRFLRKSMP